MTGPEQLEFWLEELKELPERVELPADRPRPAAASFRGQWVELHIPAEVHAGLARVGRAAGASVFMVVQAGLAVLLSRLGAGTDVPVGVPVAGRVDAVLDDLVGIFVNTLVLRTDVSGNPRFSELVGRVREASLAAFEHQDLPFEKLVEELNPVRSLGWHPLVQVLLTVMDDPGDGFELPGLQVSPEALSDGSEVWIAVDLAFGFSEQRTASGDPAGISRRRQLQHRPVYQGGRRAPTPAPGTGARSGRGRPVAASGRPGTAGRARTSPHPERMERGRR